MLLCLRWAKERLNDSKADSSARLVSVFNDVGDYDAMRRASALNLSAEEIVGASRQLSLQATCRTENRGLTRTFSVLAAWAKANVQRPILIIVWTEKGYAYPTMVYQSGGKLKGIGSHLYVFLPLCGEIKMSTGGADRKLAAGIQLNEPTVGKPNGFDAYVIATMTDSDPVLREYHNELYGSVPGAGLNDVPNPAQANAEGYNTTNHPRPPLPEPIYSEPFVGPR